MYLDYDHRHRHFVFLKWVRLCISSQDGKKRHLGYACGRKHSGQFLRLNIKLGQMQHFGTTTLGFFKKITHLKVIMRNATKKYQALNLNNATTKYIYGLINTL